jgi:glycerol-3-phosphate dehydrogenase
MKRSQIIASLKQNFEIPVLIIGAGINGIGTFRDLALQGVRCLIVDRGDFCSGASMASSHMLHGGIRYLENGEFRLVREALQERNNLLRNAPHLTYPLPTTIPIYKWFSGLFNAPLKFLGLLDKPAERGAVIIKLGLILYDAYVRGDSPMPTHRFDNRSSALANWPVFNSDIQFAATYFDGGMVSPERLALEILLDGKAEGDHALAVNYISAEGVDGNRVLLNDELTGEIIQISPQIVINAGGPWIDFINHKINGTTKFIGGTKGSHLIINHAGLREAIKDHEIFFEYLDGRIVLMFPYLEELVMIGTTDLRIDDPDQAQCTEEEIDYILSMVPHIFPSLSVSREDVVFQFTGVRPLPAAEGFTGQISRDHSIKIIEPSTESPWLILNLVGGKWTSYRVFSELVTDQVLERLDLPRLESTAQLPIGGGVDYPGGEEERQTWVDQRAEKGSLPQERIHQLLERYGTRTDQYLSVLGGSETPLSHHPEYSMEEVNYLVDEEMVTHLDDFLLRRTKLAWTNQVTDKLIHELAEIIGQNLNWTDELQKREAERAIKILRDKHAVQI